MLKIHSRAHTFHRLDANATAMRCDMIKCRSFAHAVHVKKKSNQKLYSHSAASTCFHIKWIPHDLSIGSLPHLWHLSHWTLRALEHVASGCTLFAQLLMHISCASKLLDFKWIYNFLVVVARAPTVKQFCEKRKIKTVEIVNWFGGGFST